MKCKTFCDKVVLSMGVTIHNRNTGDDKIFLTMLSNMAVNYWAGSQNIVS